MENLIFDTLAQILGWIGVIIIAYGSVSGLFLFIRQIFSKDDILWKIRIKIGQYFVLGLEFLIGKDILQSIIQPTWDDLGKLAAIVIIRTILTSFINRELKDVIDFEKEKKLVKRSS